MKLKVSKKSCHKVGYRTKAEARTALNTFGKARGAKRFYKCPHHASELWHLTSESK